MWFRKSNDFDPLETTEDFQAALAASDAQPVVLYKHSSTCGISFMARRELLDLKALGTAPIYELTVQRARSLSQQIATALGIRHESPQAIVLHQRQPVFNASHGRVTSEALQAAVAQCRTVSD